MLKIFNDLDPFFQDNYKRINVREYSRMRKITPPTASKLLNKLHEESLLLREDEKNYIYYHASRGDNLFVHLSRLYWLQKLKESGLIDFMEKEMINPLLVLFGSFSKAEVGEKSDIDLAVFSHTKKELSLERFENKLKRKIHLFAYKDKKDILKKELSESILNGFVITGEW